MGVAGIFGGGGCGINIDGQCRGGCCSWGCMVISGCWACCLFPSVFGDEHHSQAGAGALAATDDGAAMVADGAVDLCEGYHASSIAHGDNGE